MKSKTSFFNATLFRKNLTRFWPLWGMASFCGGLAPLSLLTNWLRTRERVSSVHVTEIYYEVVVRAVPILMLGYCVLCAMAVWSYLYQHRSVSLMHALPVTRDGLFVTGFLSGLAMVAIPCAVTGALSMVLSLLCGGFDPTGLLITILAVGGEGFFYFATATATAFITGHIFALPVLYFLFHFLVPLLDFLVTTFSTNMVFGLTGNYTGVAEFFCPTVYLMRSLTVNHIYFNDNSFPVNPNSFGEYYYERGELAKVMLDGGWLIAVYAAVGVLLLAIAWLLYRRRRSESAGDVIAVGWMKPLFLIGVTLVTALGGGQLLYAIFSDALRSGGYYRLLPIILCMLVAGAIGYYAASMLLAKSLRVFKGSWPALAAILAGSAVLCGILHFDLLGTAARIPEDSEINSVYFRISGNGYTLYPGQDGAALEELRQLHKAIVADRDYIVNLNMDGVYASSGERVLDYEYLTIDYALKNGRGVHRSYPLVLSRDRMKQAETFESMLDRFVNSPEVRAKLLHEGDDGYVPDGGTLYLHRREARYDLSSREAAALVAALKKDARAGTWGVADWFGDEEANPYAMDLELSFIYTAPTETGQRTTWNWIPINVRPNMENTVRCLKDLGYVEDGDLVTHEELARIWNEGETWSYGAQYDHELYGDIPPETAEAVLP